MSTSTNNFANTIPEAPLNVIRSTANETSSITVAHTSNSGSTSSSQLKARVGGSNGGDAFVNFEVVGGAEYSFGIDNSDSDKLILSNGEAPSAGDELLVVSVGGIVTKPQQPAFSAFLSTRQVGVTGDGTIYPIVCDIALNNIGGFYDTFTGFFNVPVTGFYYFSIRVGTAFGIGTGGTLGYVAINIDSISTPLTASNPINYTQSNETAIYNVSYLGYLLSGSIVGIEIRFAGGSKTIDILETDTVFSGVLLS